MRTRIFFEEVFSITKAIPSRSQLRIMWKFHKLMWRISGGRLGAKTRGMDVLELVTSGHKSMEPRSVLLFYLDGDGGPMVVGSNSGAESDPYWVKNLRAHPRARVVRGKVGLEVKARFLTGVDRSEAYQRFADRYDDYAVYVEMTEREIPVIVLETSGK